MSLKDALDFLEAYAKAKHWPQWIIEDIFQKAIPIIFLLILVKFLFTTISWLLQLRIKKILNNNLSPYYSPFDVYNSIKYYVHTKFQNVSPSEDDEPGKTYIASAKNKLIPLFINKIFNNQKAEGKYYLLLADSGMGKTTFLINLFVKYKNRIKWPWMPIKYPLKMIPLGSSNWENSIRDIDNKENTILLLDSFDEDIQASIDYKSRMNILLSITWNFRIVILTCRTQFFPDQKEEPYDTGYYSHGEQGEYKFQRLYISTFNDLDVLMYLIKKYRIYRVLKLIKAYKIAKKCPALMVRPMLLTHIEDLLENKNKYFYTYQMYEVLINKWIERESKKPGIKVKYGSSEKYAELLFSFSKGLAHNLFINRERRNGYFIHKDENFVVNEFSLNTFDSEHSNMSSAEKRSKSLLNRTADGYYKFSHKSIFEYFIAKEILEDKIDNHVHVFSGMDTSKSFYLEMVIEIFKSYNGSYSILGEKAKPMISIKLEDINNIYQITITNFKNITPKFLKCFPSLKSLYIADFNFKWLYEIYKRYINLIADFKSYEHISYEATKLLLEERNELFKISEENYISKLRMLKEHLNNLEDCTVIIEKIMFRSSLIIEEQCKIESVKLSKRENLLKQIRSKNTDSSFSIENKNNTLDDINTFLNEIEILKSLLPNCDIIY